MHIIELETIPREPGALQQMISDARRNAKRHSMVVMASSIMIFLGICILLYGFVQTQSVQSGPVDYVYLPVVNR